MSLERRLFSKEMGSIVPTPPHPTVVSVRLDRGLPPGSNHGVHPAARVLSVLYCVVTPPSPKPPVQQRIPIAAIAVPILIMGGLIAIVVVQSRLSEESMKELHRGSIERLEKQLDAKFGKLENQNVYVLVDAERRAAAHPTTFEIPSRARRTSCKVGDLVKVILEPPPGAPARQATGERPWLIIEEVIPGPQPLYVGRLDNDLVVFTEVKGTERIVFGPEHIIQLWEDREKK